MDSKDNCVTIDHKRLIILFGTQTGKALSIAQDIHNQVRHSFNASNGHCISTCCYSLDLIGTKYNIEDETLAVIVVATVGEGEAPYNTVKFWRQLCKRAKPRGIYLRKLRYSLFALGDSNYERFAIFGRQLDTRLQELGAQRFHPTGFGDDSVGTELGFRLWLDGLIPAIQIELSKSRFKLPIIQNSIKMNSYNGESANKGDTSVKLESDDHQKNMITNQIPDKPDKMDSSTNCQLLNLTLPAAFKEKTLSVQLIEKGDFDSLIKPENLVFQKFPLMDSQVFNAKLVDMKCLTHNSWKEGNCDDKLILEATFEGDYLMTGWNPGDAFGFFVGNSDYEVDLVLNSLGLNGRGEDTVIVESKTHAHLPKKTTLYHLIKYYLEIRAIPKKGCLRMFGDYCSDPIQSRELHELSSREGSEMYNRKILKLKTTILDILVMYASCKPPLDVLLHNVPCFVPRYYSLINLYDDDQQRFKVAFNVISMKEINQRKESQLFGVFTGLMYRIWKKGSHNGSKSFSVEEAGEIVPANFKAFRRRNDRFKPAEMSDDVMIMIAAGTGITPFLSFLSYRQREKQTLNPDEKLGETWLFYGCRDSQKDYIYKEELKNFHSQGIVHELHPCFSRENGKEGDARHVQDLIHLHKERICRLIREESVYIYVCGDLEKLSVSVFNAFIESFSSAGGLETESASLLMNQMRDKGRYLQDIWL